MATPVAFSIRNDNMYLFRDVAGYYHAVYTGHRNPGNPDYINDLKNTFNNFPQSVLDAACGALRQALRGDLVAVMREMKLDQVMVCVVPRAKVRYEKNQLLFKATVKEVVNCIAGMVDGTECIVRKIDTRTTHLGRDVRNYNNEGDDPYPGITKGTCTISSSVFGKDVLLIDDLYTARVKIDEDVIQALFEHGARSVTFYSIGKAG
ncbi:MAG TPA: hypothetical protein VE028_00470 [Nitratidesulfovibrio sp.]|nr:hypothetical protein [Nitratidesulfovibrio sp.]